MAYGRGFVAQGSVLIIEEGQAHASPYDHASILDDAIRGEVQSLGPGEVGDLGSVLCLKSCNSNYIFSVNNDPEDPPAGGCFFYLYRFCGGTEQYGHGTASSGAERFPSAGDCP